VQYVCSPYGPPPQVPRPTAPGDPSTPRHDASQVDLSFLFKSDLKFLNLSHSFLLQGSQTGQAPVMTWGGSPAAWQPPTWPTQPPAGFWPTRRLTFLVSRTSRLQVRVLSLLPHRCRGHLHLEGKPHPRECLHGWHRSDLLPRQQW
jgi:hypothetical protein